MNIKLIEPLNISEEKIYELSAGFEKAGHNFTYYPTLSKNIEEQKQRTADADILIIANNPLPDEVIRSAKALKMISVAFTGINHLGVTACKENHITISNAAGYSDDSVAELVLGLTISVLRNITKGDAIVRKGGTIAGLQGVELRGKKVGIVGTGHIGTKTAKLFQAFGCEVIAYAPHPKKEIIAMGIQYINIDELMQNSDIISLHFPLNGQTKGFIDAEKLNLMQSTAILINCARGGVVDNTALAELLNAGEIAGAGIDVFDMEPPIPADYPLLKAKNTVLTPHVAYASNESMLIRADIVFDNVYAYLAGKPQNVVG